MLTLLYLFLGVYGFNQLVSDEMTLNRTVPDLREEECQFWDYPKILPKASVILVFHNEGWSTLLRTVNSGKTWSNFFTLNLFQIGNCDLEKTCATDFYKLISLVKSVMRLSRNSMCSENVIFFFSYSPEPITSPIFGRSTPS